MVKTVHQEALSDSSKWPNPCAVSKETAVERKLPDAGSRIRNVKVEYCELRVLVDTGATVNVRWMNSHFSRYSQTGINCKSVPVFCAHMKLRKVFPRH